MKRTVAKMIPLGALTLFLLALAVSGNTTSAVSPGGATCSISLTGGLTSTELNPAGNWALTSSGCSVTGSSKGVTWGTFTGAFNSSSTTGTVIGTWSTSQMSESVSASSQQFSISVNTAAGSVPQTLGLDSQFQGVLSQTAGPELLVTGATGQISTG